MGGFFRGDFGISGRNFIVVANSRVTETVPEFALNCGPDNFAPAGSCKTVFVTDVNMLCDFMSLFATKTYLCINGLLLCVKSCACFLLTLNRELTQ